MKNLMNLQLFAEEDGALTADTQDEVLTDEERQDLLSMSSFLRESLKGSEEEDTPEEDTQEEQVAEEAEETEEAEEDPEESEETEETEEEAEETEEEAEETEEEAEESAKIKFSDGREVTLDEVLEWEKGYMRQADYTRKTQELAEIRRQLQQEWAHYNKEEVDYALQIARQIARDPIGTLQKLQEYYESQGIYEPKSPEILAYEDKLRQLEEEKKQLEQLQLEQQQLALKADLERRINALAEAHGKDFDREKLIQYMIDNNFYNPEEAWKIVSFDVTKGRLQKQIDELNKKLKTVEEEAVKKYLNKKTSKEKKPLPVGSKGSSTPPIRINPPKTLEDAKKAAMARLENT